MLTTLHCGMLFIDSACTVFIAAVYQDQVHVGLELCFHDIHDQVTVFSPGSLDWPVPSWVARERGGSWECGVLTKVEVWERQVEGADTAGGC